jgi:hypothetical protein
MKYARIVNNAAVDTRDTSPEGCFTQNIVEEFVEVPDEVQGGWINDSGTWSAPAIKPEPAPIPVEVIPPVVSTIQFKLLFKSAERIAIKTSTDPIVIDFFDIVNDIRLTEVNLNSKSTRDALGYLEGIKLLAAGRKDEILTGVEKE